MKRGTIPFVWLILFYLSPFTIRAQPVGECPCHESYIQDILVNVAEYQVLILILDVSVLRLRFFR